MLENFVTSQIQKRQCLNSVIFIQDGAPPHIGLCVQMFGRQHFANDRVISRAFQKIWPPHSPDS